MNEVNKKFTVDMNNFSYVISGEWININNTLESFIYNHRWLVKNKNCEVCNKSKCRHDLNIIITGKPNIEHESLLIKKLSIEIISVKLISCLAHKERTEEDMTKEFAENLSCNMILTEDLEVLNIEFDYHLNTFDIKNGIPLNTEIYFIEQVNEDYVIPSDIDIFLDY